MADRWRALATLAGLDPKAVDADLEADVQRILAYVERLEAFDDASVAPLHHPNLEGDAVDVDALRADTPQAPPVIDREAIAPAWRDGRFEVARTVES
jgi:Asp-tRNA(Asn)/Glu-tRNA(Gln) amidotransferase C subunit